MTPRSVTSEMCALQQKNTPDMASAKEYINEALSIAMHAMKAAIHSTLGSSPGSLIFSRDMFAQRRAHLIHENHIRENQKHHQCNYVPKKRVLKKR